MVVAYNTLPRPTAPSGSVEYAADDPRLTIVGGRCVRSGGTLTWDAQTELQFSMEPEEHHDISRESVVIEFVMNAGRNHFNLLSDGCLLASFSTPQLVARTKSYTFSMPGRARPLTISLFKRTEAGAAQLWPPSSTLPVILHGVRIPAGWRLVEPTASLRARRQRRIEVIGDSDVAGFGNEGDPSPISFRGLLGAKLGTQNGINTWGQLLARMLNAEASVVAISGVGVCVNAMLKDHTTFLSDYYDRDLLSCKRESGVSPPTAADWKPQLVLIEVGANDLFGGRTPPSEEAFISAYVALLRQVRERRPPPCMILCVVACMDTPSYQAAPGGVAKLGEYTHAAVNRFVGESHDHLVHCAAPFAVGKGMRWPQDGGCVEHWGVRGLAKYAEAVCDVIEGLAMHRPPLPCEVSSWARVQPHAVPI